MATTPSRRGITVIFPTAFSQKWKRNRVSCPPRSHPVFPWIGKPPSPRLKTLEEARAESISSSRTIASLFTIFSVLVLTIAVTGIGSTLALSVRQRAREIGIRMALGANPANVVTHCPLPGMLLVMLGLAFGVAGAIGLTRLLKGCCLE